MIAWIKRLFTKPVREAWHPKGRYIILCGEHHRSIEYVRWIGKTPYVGSDGCARILMPNGVVDAPYKGYSWVDTDA